MCVTNAEEKIDISVYDIKKIDRKV